MRREYVLAVAAACLGLARLASGRAGPAEAGVLCAVGDLHGDPLHALKAFQLCGAVNNDWRWVGGGMTVVQTGDVMDRGNASLPLLRRLWALRDDAAAAGGELVLLVGNHELLNMQGATHYVHKDELQGFGGRTAWQTALHPVHGEVGQRLLQQPGAVVRGRGACRSLFIHAGLRLSTAASAGSLGALNSALHEQIGANRGPLLDATEGPLWWRGYARPHVAGLRESDACAEVGAALRAVGDGARRMVVGHNIVPFVSSRCEGVLQMIDVGMSGAYEGRPAAWRCKLKPHTAGEGAEGDGGRPVVRALYAGGREPPPELCDACDALRGQLAERAATSLRGADPHGDCQNYCTERPRTARARPRGKLAHLASHLFGVDNGTPDPEAVKLEF